MGQPSSIDQLPETDRQWLDRELHQRGFCGYAEVAGLLQSAQAELAEAISTLRRYADRVDLDPARLAEFAGDKWIASQQPDLAVHVTDARAVSQVMKIAAAFRFCWLSVTPSTTVFLNVVTPDMASVMTMFLSTCWMVRSSSRFR